MTQDLDILEGIHSSIESQDIVPMDMESVLLVQPDQCAAWFRVLAMPFMSMDASSFEGLGHQNQLVCTQNSQTSFSRDLINLS